MQLRLRGRSVPPPSAAPPDGEDGVAALSALIDGLDDAAIERLAARSP